MFHGIFAYEYNNIIILLQFFSENRQAMSKAFQEKINDAKKDNIKVLKAEIHPE